MEIFTLLHQSAATLEMHAIQLGYAGAQAFVSGGCRDLFCIEEADCAVLEDGQCRHADSARPSMSGYGVNVTRLVESAGWKMNWAKKDRGLEDQQTASVVGLVLLK